MAGAQIMLTHGMADGKLGLSVDDVVYSYYGNRNGSKLESKLYGSMKDNGTPEARLEIIKWARDGAPDAEWESHIKEAFRAKLRDVPQHHARYSRLLQLEEAKKSAQINEGASVQSLTRVSHIHLFGISFIFFFVGWIFTYSTRLPPKIKALIVFTPFAFLIVDIASWWLTKLNPNFAWLVIIGGIGYSMASSIMIFTSLFQMWITPLRQGRSPFVEEA